MLLRQISQTNTHTQTDRQTNTGVFRQADKHRQTDKNTNTYT